MAPRLSLLSLFLELADGTSTQNNPAPWCWEHWKVNFDRTIPPWHPEFPEPKPADDPRGTRQKKVSAAKALAETYYAKSRPSRAEWWSKLEAYHVEGREYATKWLEEQRKPWKLNQVIDKVLADHNIDMVQIANDEVNGVSCAPCLHAEVTFLTMWCC